MGLVNLFQMDFEMIKRTVVIQVLQVRLVMEDRGEVENYSGLPLWRFVCMGLVKNQFRMGLTNHPFQTSLANHLFRMDL
jgi:hypothetical protein